jgi:hypothetical protein
VRERLISRLEALGYETSIQDTMLCPSFESDWGGFNYFEIPVGI